MSIQRRQYGYSIGLVMLVSLICYGISPYLGYRVIAFILLLTVSLIAVSFDIMPVLVSATLSAFIWDFFFIPPRFTLHVDNTEDVILLIMYFVIALINAVLTFKIRTAEKLARKKEEEAKTLRLYDTLLNSLSHELRTPISTIIAATDNMQAGNKNIGPEEQSEMVNEISKASFRLNQQVDNLLNMSRLESGIMKPKLEMHDLTEIVYESVCKIEEKGVFQKISISINPDLPMILTDKLLLSQVIYNLVNNATIYTSAGSLIKITALAYGDRFELSIEDNGDGFPPEEIQHVFTKFYRLKKSKPGGIGLGLSIVKGFVEALNGFINVENVSTGGARFIISLPAKSTFLKPAK